jgi:hypothetical protein
MAPRIACYISTGGNVSSGRDRKPSSFSFPAAHKEKSDRILPRCEKQV